MTLLYSSSKDVDLFQLAKLLNAVDAEAFAGDVSRLAVLVQSSTRVVWAAHGADLVAFGSVLSDSAHFGLVTYVLVQPDRQKRGIEQELVNRLLAGEPGVTFFWRVTAGSTETAGSLGFSPSGADCWGRRGLP
jgi:GNAT superfamily N-acetyltransferase